MSKIIRDKIPDIAKSEGRVLDTKILTGFSLSLGLADKLVEESKEVVEALKLGLDVEEELADLIEVYEALVKQLANKEAISKKREAKAESRGRFDAGILLV